MLTLATKKRKYAHTSAVWIRAIFTPPYSNLCSALDTQPEMCYHAPMGYYTRINGELSFHPPLSHLEVQGISHFVGKRKWSSFAFEIDEHEEITDKGVLSSQSSHSIVPESDDSGKNYDLVEDLQHLVDQIKGRSISGEFRVTGEDAGDIRRVLLVDGKVVEWSPQLTWPDGVVSADIVNTSIEQRGLMTEHVCGQDRMEAPYCLSCGCWGDTHPGAGAGYDCVCTNLHF